MVFEFGDGRLDDLGTRRVEYGELPRMRRDAYAERAEAAAERGEVVRVLVPPAQPIHRVRRERNQVARDAVQQDPAPLEEVDDLAERVEVLADQLALSAAVSRSSDDRCGSSRCSR